VSRATRLPRGDKSGSTPTTGKHHTPHKLFRPRPVPCLSPTRYSPPRARTPTGAKAQGVGLPPTVIRHNEGLVYPPADTLTLFQQVRLHTHHIGVRLGIHQGVALFFDSRGQARQCHRAEHTPTVLTSLLPTLARTLAVIRAARRVLAATRGCATCERRAGLAGVSTCTRLQDITQAANAMTRRRARESGTRTARCAVRTTLIHARACAEMCACIVVRPPAHAPSCCLGGTAAYALVTGNPVAGFTRAIRHPHPARAHSVRSLTPARRMAQLGCDYLAS